MLVPKALSQQLFAFMKEANSKTVEDPEQAQRDFCDQVEEAIYNAIRSASYQILPGVAVVATSTGPAANPLPITVTVS